METRIAYESPIGRLILVARAGKLVRLVLPPVEGEPESAPPLDALTASPDAEALSRVCAALDAYFAGELRDFDVPLAVEGTPFERRVWNALAAIPYGETV